MSIIDKYREQFLNIEVDFDYLLKKEDDFNKAFQEIDEEDVREKVDGQVNERKKYYERLISKLGENPKLREFKEYVNTGNQNESICILGVFEYCAKKFYDDPNNVSVIRGLSNEIIEKDLNYTDPDEYVYGYIKEQMGFDERVFEESL